ncbi:MAG: hypothetical protein ABJH52_07200 [Henriciella sp.]
MFLGIVVAWLIGFYVVVIALAALFKTFWQTKWSDRNKAAIITLAVVSILPALWIASVTQWAFMIAYGLAIYAAWTFAHEEREFRD